MYSTDDIKRLRLFLSRAERLKVSAVGLMKNLSLKMSYKSEEPFHTKYDGPDLVAVSASLVDLRPFMLQTEPVNLFSICNLIHQKSDDAVAIENAKQCRVAWKALTDDKSPPPGGMHLQVNDQKLTAHDISDMWLNGEFFHLDNEKHDFLESLHSSPMGKMAYFSFIDLMQRRTMLVLWLSNAVVAPLLDQDVAVSQT